jgi:AraC-like DNA-binding protein
MIARLLTAVKDAFEGHVKELASVLSMLLLCAIAAALSKSFEQFSSLFELCSCVIFSISLYSMVANCIYATEAYISELCVLVNSFMPVMAAIYFAGGNAAVAVVSGSSMAIFLNVMQNFCSVILLPILKVVFGFSLVSALSPVCDMSGITKLLKNSFTKDLEMLPGYRYYHLYLDFQTTPPFLGRELLEIPFHSDPVMLYLIRAIQSMIEEYQKSVGRCYVTATADTELFAQITGVLEVVLEHLRKNYKLSFVENEKIEQALQYIEEHYAEKLKNDDIAAALHVDTRYLSRLFAKHVDMSPYQYLTQYRIDRAIAELKNGHSVAETAYMCGFQTENAFRIAFKKLLGCSPTAMVKKN